MKDLVDTRDADTAQKDSAAWIRRMQQTGADCGYFEPLGDQHAALFNDAAPTLLVTFETEREIRAGQPDELPLGYRVAHANGWSSLTLIARSPTWFRDPAVYAFFDRLTDLDFFENYDRVVFFGGGMCGYAACAYAVTAPGATVLALSPQATLDARVASWDDRFVGARKHGFTERYGYAPDMVEAAGKVFVAFDPLEQLDAMHAALFTRPFVTKLPCPRLGPDMMKQFSAMGILPDLLRAACEGRLDAPLFWRLYRARRDLSDYLARLMLTLEDDGRIMLNAVLCRSVARRVEDPQFRYRFVQLKTALDEANRELPAPRA